jgi:hypothetical protein
MNADSRMSDFQFWQFLYNTHHRDTESRSKSEGKFPQAKPNR